MTTIVFIHSTGTRDPYYTQTFNLVQAELTTRRTDLRVAPCYWGGSYGSRLQQDGASIPLYDSARSPGTVTSEMEGLALWWMLYQDPLYEIRTLAAPTLRPASSANFIPGRFPPGDQLKNQIAAFQPSPDLKIRLSAAGIDKQFDEARRIVTTSTAYFDMLSAAISPFDRYRLAVARAIVAQAIELCTQQQIYARIACDAPLRDTLVTQVTEAIGPSERGVGSWITRQLCGLALRLGAMDYIQRRRGALTDAVFPFAGDILLYQAKGAGIRTFIRNRIEEVSQQDYNIVVLAHSLGGIMCVDLLVQDYLPAVKLLVTVGSQAPFLYELGALPTLSFGEPLPPHFPAWLNIYDLRDLLSYVGAKVFPNRVQDVLIDSKQPFPHTHGAYWTNRVTWDTIVERLP